MNYEIPCNPIPGADVPGYRYQRDQNAVKHAMVMHRDLSHGCGLTEAFARGLVRLARSNAWAGTGAGRPTANNIANALRRPLAAIGASHPARVQLPGNAAQRSDAVGPDLRNQRQHLGAEGNCTGRIGRQSARARLI